MSIERTSSDIISELTSELWNLNDKVIAYKKGNVNGLTITKADAKTIAIGFRDSITSKLAELKTQLRTELG